MSGHDVDDEDYGSEEEELNEDETYDGKKNVTIILLDVCSSMFNTPRIFKTCLLAIYQIMDQMLLKAHKRNISICLLRDEDIVLTALNDNIIESTKTIYDLLHTSIETLKQKYERKNAASLRYTLTECIKQFYNLEKVNPYIVVLTNDEDPIKGDQTEKLSAIDVALSFKELNVKLVVLPLKEEFNYDVFYKELIKAANDDSLDIFQNDNEQTYTSVEDLNDILDCIIKDKVNIKRHIFKLYKKNDKEVCFWTQMRYLVNNKHLYQNSTISRSNNNKLKQEVKGKENFDMDELILAVEEDCEPIKFKKSESLFVKMPFEFRLLNISSEKQGSMHYMSKRGFILQYDETCENKKKQNVFCHMWEYCKNKNRLLICGFNAPNFKQQPKIVELSADTFQGKPCFIGQFLINYDEIQEDTDEEDSEEDDENMIDKSDPELGLVCDMIDKMKLKKFNPYHWNDLNYNEIAGNIKAQFLDIEPEPVECCFPSDEEITKQLGATNVELQEIFGFTVDPPAAKRSKH